MESFEYSVNINEEKGKLKQKFASLTDDDQLFEEGRNEVMLSRFLARLGQTKDELDNIASTLPGSFF